MAFIHMHTRTVYKMFESTVSNDPFVSFLCCGDFYGYKDGFSVASFKQKVCICLFVIFVYIKWFW